VHGKNNDHTEGFFVVDGTADAHKQRLGYTVSGWIPAHQSLRVVSNTAT
jgi:hypothetical protein